LYLHYRLTPEEPDFPMKIQEGDQIKLLLLHEENLFNFVKNSKSAINIKFSHSNKPIVKKLKKDQFTDGSGSKLKASKNLAILPTA